jgi:ligand-binding SRPBCC domain-containing protein
MPFSYRTEQWLPHSVPAVFAALANPGNLPRLMPAWQKARIVEASIMPPLHPPTPSPRAIVAAGVGTQLLLSFYPFPHSPFRVRWEAQITEFAWNDHFVDLQLRGPFAFWNHCHTVSAMTRDGIRGACVVDLIEYELPFGPLGRLAHHLWLRTQIERSFAFRQEQFAELLAKTIRAPVSPPPANPESQPPVPSSPAPAALPLQPH